jgi:hypothetical protein
MILNPFNCITETIQVPESRMVGSSLIWTVVPNPAGGMDMSCKVEVSA